jgi:signal transduction histidine kinase
MNAIGVPMEPDLHAHPKPTKILLVDDLPANLLALEAVLDNRGYEIVTAMSGPEAIASISVNDFAVILLDVMMPEMDGFQTASRIREIEQARRTPIIFVTAFRELDEQMHRGYGSGAVDFLYKPIDPEVLRFKVSVFADLQRQADLLKSYSMQLQATNAVLEQRVEERTAELRISNEDLRQFAYVASHDLKEPLRTIATFAALLSQRHKERLDGEAAHLIDHIVDSARRMDSLLVDLLAYSTHINKASEAAAPCDSEAALAGVLMMLDGLIREKNAVITNDPLPLVAAEFNELVQLFQNLIGNGLKYQRNGVPRVHVSAEQIDDEWLFSVRDNGVGIDSQCYDQIFGIFKRAHGREYPGNGIGLAICKKIVERRHGRIWVESALGSGSTFYFTLPLQGSGN